MNKATTYDSEYNALNISKYSLPQQMEYYIKHLANSTNPAYPEANDITTGYSYDNVISAQAYLELLSYLEESIYRDNIVNLRSFLRGYLYNNFDLSIHIYEDSKLKLQLGLPISESITYGKSSNCICFEKSVCDPKSVREYFNEYLTNHCSSFTQAKCKYPCYASQSSLSPKEAKYHYYLPYSQLPEFLLTFSFNDGRIFDENSSQNKRIMRFSKKRCRTEKSYLARMQDFFNVYNSVPINKSSKTVHYYRLSNLFFWNKCARLFSYYKEYTSNVFLEKIVKSFELTYHDVMNLKVTIINTIFKDEAFMAQCLSSNYLDPFYLFDIFFQNTLIEFRFPLFNNPHNSSLPELLQQLKQMTFQYLDNNLDVNSKITNLYSTIQSQYVTVPEAQSFILDELQKNPFIRKYYNYSYSELLFAVNEFFKNILPYDFLLNYLPF